METRQRTGGAQQHASSSPNPSASSSEQQIEFLVGIDAIYDAVREAAHEADEPSPPGAARIIAEVAQFKATATRDG